MNSNFTIPNFPKLSEKYDEQLLESILFQIIIALEEAKTNGEVRAGTLSITDIPTASTGLRSGDVWSDSGVLTIVT